MTKESLAKMLHTLRRHMEIANARGPIKIKCGKLERERERVWGEEVSKKECLKVKDTDTDTYIHPSSEYFGPRTSITHA